MTVQSRTTLKTYFETGDRPTQSQFGDFIDSLVSMNDADTSPSILGNKTFSGRVTVRENFITSTCVLANSVTDGFLRIPIMAGSPTGTPTAFTGQAALVYDTTASKLWIYANAWKGVSIT